MNLAPASRRPRPVRRSSRRRGGFTLLETILATAILATAVIGIGELLRLGTENARRTREQTMAQLHCENKFAEIMSGLILPEIMPPTALEDDPDWVWSADVQPHEIPGLIRVTVSVSPAIVVDRRPAGFELVRLLRDPDFLPPTASQTSPATQTSQSSGSTGGSR